MTYKAFVTTCIWLLVVILIAGSYRIVELRQEVKDLRKYISAGCHGHYQGEGEEPTQDDVSTERLSNQKVLIQCEDERETVLSRIANRTQAIITCEDVQP